MQHVGDLAVRRFDRADDPHDGAPQDIAALAAATFLIRDGGFDGAAIHLFEEQRHIGGSLDAVCVDYTLRGGGCSRPSTAARTTPPGAGWGVRRGRLAAGHGSLQCLRPGCGR
ncbi:oleate hydratase [Streptomyces canus]|uniref:oleate hydratase n=1 Tax=Streptomyces canus TaxID=58343 RepID=UPI00380D6E25